MKDTLIVINSFIHDMATGVWLGVLFIMYIIFDNSTEIITISQGAIFVNNIMDKLWVLGVISMSIVIITGIIRGLTFKFYGWTGDIAKGRKRLLMIKHIILAFIVVIGLYVQFFLVNRISG